MVHGYFFGKGPPPPLIGGVLLTGTRVLHCVTYYSMLDDLLQNMGDCDPPLNVSNFDLLNDMSLTCGSVFTNLCLPPCFNGFEPHRFTTTCRVPILRTSGSKDFRKRRLTQHSSLIEVSVPVVPFAKTR